MYPKYMGDDLNSPENQSDFFAYRDGPDFLGSKEFAQRNPVLNAHLKTQEGFIRDNSNNSALPNQQQDKTSESKGVDNNTKQFVDFAGTWRKIIEESEHTPPINVAALHEGEIIEIESYHGGKPFRLKITSGFKPNIIRPSLTWGTSPIRLQLMEGEPPLDCIDGNHIVPREEVCLVGSSFGGTSVQVNTIRRGFYLHLQKMQKTNEPKTVEVMTYPIKQVRILRPNPDGSLQEVDILELMGLIPANNQEPYEYSEEYGKIYDLFRQLAEIFPIPPSNSEYPSISKTYNDPTHDRIMVYSAVGCKADSGPLDQQIFIMDKRARTAYEIYRINELPYIIFQVRAYTGIKDPDSLHVYQNHDYEVGINYSNHPLFDKTQYCLCAEQAGSCTNYGATLQADGTLTQGQLYQWLPYIPGRTATVSNQGFLEVTGPDEVSVSTEIVSPQKIMPIIDEFLSVVTQSNQSGERENNQRYKKHANQLLKKILHFLRL